MEVLHDVHFQLLSFSIYWFLLLCSWFKHQLKPTWLICEVKMKILMLFLSWKMTPYKPYCHVIESCHIYIFERIISMLDDGSICEMILMHAVCVYFCLSHAHYDDMFILMTCLYMLVLMIIYVILHISCICH